MTRAQALFDEKVMTAFDELQTPMLHSVLNDPEIRKYTYGAKGAGWQGDRSVQFLAKSEVDSKRLQDYLQNRRGMPSFRLTIKPGQTVKKAIIAAAVRKARIVEVPVEMRERQGGKSSINPVRSVYYMIKVSLALVLARFSA